MTSQNTYTIVVGVDGSPSSKAALRWAVWHANLVKGRITAVQAWDAPAIFNWQPPEGDDSAHETVQALSESLKEAAGDSTIEITKEVTQGHPARAILDAAHEEEADLVVMGHRGHGGFTEALLGSVSQHVVHHARIPVVIVRG